MKLCVSFKKSPFSREELPVFVDGVFVGCARGGQSCFSLSDAEHYFLQLGDKITSEVSVLLPRSDTVSIAVKRQKKTLSVDVTGGVLHTFPIERLLCALGDASAVEYLCEWEKNAYYAMLYAQLNREDAILESPHVKEICDALVAVGDTVVGERLRGVVEACELTLPLSPMEKLTPAQESALVESYHQLWMAEENASQGEGERSWRAVMAYIYMHQKEA